MTKPSEQNRPGRRRHPEGPKKVVPLHLSVTQRDFLAELFVTFGMSATSLVERGLRVFGAIVAELPQAVGPFQVAFGLRLGKSETAPLLVAIAKETGLSQAEVVRRLIDKAAALWQEERQQSRPFTEVFIYSSSPEPEAPAAEEE